MSSTFTGINGITLCDRNRVYPGVTLLTPFNGMSIWLIDMVGEYVNQWKIGYKLAACGELLPNGNLLCAGKAEDSPLADLEETGGVLLELDWDGKKVWEYKNPYLHHTPYRMKNGNTLVLKWIKVPNEIAAKLEGGIPGTEDDGIMWGSTIQEITPDGEITWEWIEHEHLNPEIDTITPFCSRNTYTHTNAVAELHDGNVVVSFMKSNTVGIIDKKTGVIKWRWGPPEDLAHQHYLTVLDNGNICIFNNGLHSYYPMGASYIVEVNPNTNSVVWLFGADSGDRNFYSPTMSNCQRLPNGNTLICEGTRGRLFEITPGFELVWEYVNNLSTYETSAIESKYCPVYGAYRYGVDYSGLKRSLPVAEKRQSAPGTPSVGKGKEAVMERIRSLGY
ncbi:aryl-sulfate sulfotransferase [Chloroflexota bacterium]